MLAELTQAFRTAGIPLQLASESPDDPLTPDPQIGIWTGRQTGAQRVWFWRGRDRRCRADVIDVDPDSRQLILRMWRPDWFCRSVADRPALEDRAAALRALARANKRLVREDCHRWFVEEHLPPEEPILLVGYDHTRLFVWRLPAGRTVRDAHVALVPRSVRDEALCRLGALYFVPVRPQELRALSADAPSSPSLRIAHPPFPFPSPLTAAVAAEGVDIRGTIYVRGTVTSSGLIPLHLPDWRRVVPNAAVIHATWPRFWHITSPD